MAFKAPTVRTIEELEQDLGEVNKDLASASDEDKEYLTGIRETIRQQLVGAFQKANAQDTAGGPVMDSLLVGAGSGMNRVAQDIGSIPSMIGSYFGGGDLQEQITGQSAFDRHRADIKDERALMDPLKAISPAARVGETVGEIAATLPLGGFTGVTSKGIGAVGRVAANTALGAAQGALGSDDPLQGALWGGAGTGLLEGLGEGYRAFARARSPGSSHGIDLLPADVFPAAARAEGAARSSVFGGGHIESSRLAQGEQVAGAMEDLARRNPGSGQAALESMEQRMGTRKAMAGRLYDDVEATTRGITVGPNQQTWRTEATQIVLDEMAKPAGRQDRALIRKLRGYLEEPNTIDWGTLRNLRSDLKADVRDAYKGTSQIGSKGVGELERVRRVVERDLRTNVPPAGRQAVDRADAFYRQNVAQPYGRKGKSAVRELMGKETSEEVVNNILSPRIAGNANLVDRVASSMTGAGRREMGASLISELRRVATGADGAIDPRTAADFIRQRMPAFRAFVPREQIEQLSRTLGGISAGSTGTLPSAGVRLASGVAPIAAGGLAAMAAPGGEGPTSDINRAAQGFGWAGGTLGVEAGLAGLASAVATGRPGPALNAMLKTFITTKSRLADDEEETAGAY